MSDLNFQKQVQEETDELAQLLIRKNADYGDSFGKQFQKYGLHHAIWRLEDKLSRLENLMNQPAQVKDESIIDTIQDVAGYAILTLLELKKHENQSK